MCDAHLDWCQMEAKSCRSTSLPALVCSSLPLPFSHYTSNPIVLSSLKIWSQFRTHFKFKTPSTLAPLTNNHMFAPSVIDCAFRIWSRNGIKTVRDLYDSNIFSSFQRLKDKYALSGNDLFRYFQVRHFVQTQFSSYPHAPPKLSWENCLEVQPNQKGSISRLYDLLSAFDKHTLSKAKLSREAKIGGYLSQKTIGTPH